MQAANQTALECGADYNLFPRATSQADMRACLFGGCREGQRSRSLMCCRFEAQSACCGGFDLDRWGVASSVFFKRCKYEKE